MRSIALRALVATMFGLPALAPPALAQPVVRLPAADRMLPGRPAPVFSIGAEDGRSWEMLSGVRAVAFDRQDNLYVLDGGNHRVLVFDGRGRFVRQIGKQGRGPGELISPVQLAVTPTGDVVVSDLGRRAYSVFGRDGTFKHNVAFGGGGAPLAGRAMKAHPRGGVVTLSEPGGFAPNAPAGTVSGEHSLLWHPMTPAGRATTLFRSRQEAVRSGAAPGAGGPGTQVRTMSPVVFTPQLHWSVLPSAALAVAHTSRYSIRLVQPNGAVTRVLERPIAPRAVTARDREAVRERRRHALTTGEGLTFVTADGRSSLPIPPQLIRDLENLQFADQVPVISALVTDAAGRLWVERSVPELDRSGPVDILAPEGRYVGSLPAGTALPDAFGSSGRAAYIERDDMGVERVVVRTLPAAWR
jgi:hypothetical protein